MLIIKQVLGTCSCKSEKLLARLRQVRALLRKIKNAQIHYVGRGKNQIDVLASKALKEPIIGAVRFEVESLQDIIGFLEIGEPPLHFTKGE